MRIAVIGGGPAGLRAAEVAVSGGAEVVLYDAKPSVGRKFLVAGRGGMNITHDEPFERFVSRYSADPQESERWESMLRAFDSAALRAWALELGVETFRASTGRVYPKEMTAAPLLRRWVRRLRERGVEFALRHEWAGFASGSQPRLSFLERGVPREVCADAVVLALGGGSWSQTGSDGRWTSILRGLGVAVDPLVAANCGWECAWTPGVLAAAEGRPLKNIAVSAGGDWISGELMVTRYGLEGGPIYQLGPQLRKMSAPALIVDFKPSVSVDALVAKMGTAKRDLLREARLRWKLGEAVSGLLEHLPGFGPFGSPRELAQAVKACRIPLMGPRPPEEAISSGGGVRWEELDEWLMLRRMPGVFLAGEMIGWEAPTGGYLMQGCFATGTRAAKGALRFLEEGGPSGEFRPGRQIGIEAVR